MREAPNQSNQLLADIRLGKHDGCEAWGVADNKVWFLVWNKDLSSAKHLFNLVLELRVECRKKWTLCISQERNDCDWNGWEVLGKL